MKIAFDASDLCTGRADGTTRYTAELVKRLSGMDKSIAWELYGPCSPHPLPLPIRGEGSVKWNGSPFPFAWTQTRFAWELFRDKPDVLFMPIQQLPILRRKKMKTVAVIHDLAFHEFPEQFRYKDWLLLHTFSAQVAHEADAIIAVSQATKADIETYYGRTENVHVIHHGIDHERFRVFSEQEKAEGFKKLQKKYPALRSSTGSERPDGLEGRQAQGKPYILYVGQIQPRKNIVRLVEAFERLTVMPGSDPASTWTPGQARGDKLSLVIAGGHGWNNKEIYERIDASPVRDRIIVPGPIDDDLLPALYANAQAFVLPSLQEGFGIPLLEAAACGVPVVTSNRSSMKEIMEGVGVLVNPEDAVSIADGIQEALKQRKTLSEKSINHAQQFSWDTTAQKTLNILKGVYPEPVEGGDIHD